MHVAYFFFNILSLALQNKIDGGQRARTFLYPEIYCSMVPPKILDPFTVSPAVDVPV